MKSKLLFLIIICGALTANGQSEKAFAININAHNSVYPSFGTISNQHFGFPSFEYQIRNGKKILSFELAKFLTKKAPTFSFDGQTRNLLYTDKQIHAIARVQLQRLFRDSSKKLQPYWGAALSPFYSRTHRVPLYSTVYPDNIASAGVSHHFSLGAYYNFGRYFLNANALVGVGSIGVVWQNVDDPNTAQISNFRVLNFEMFNQDHLFRIGIGMKL